METKEKKFEGVVLNGFLMLFVNLVLTFVCLPLMFILGHHWQVLGEEQCGKHLLNGGQ